MKRILGLALLSLTLACTGGGDSKKTIWIYASTYKEVIALYDVELKKVFPDVKIEWYQAGSETVSSKVLAELNGGQTQADLMMTSDLFFYQEMKAAGQLLPIDPATLAKAPNADRDADGAFVVTRFPVMVLAHNVSVPEAERPKSFKELLDPKWKGKLTMPSPLESGTALTTVLHLQKLYGDDYFKGLRKNGAVAAGGNGATLARMQSGEFPVGMVLMENVLQAWEKKQNSVGFTVPEEGAVAVPSPMAIFRSTKNPELAQQVLAWFLGPEAQNILVKGWVYSVIEGAPTPAGAPAWDALKMMPWSLADFEVMGKNRQPVKDTFQKLVLQ